MAKAKETAKELRRVAWQMPEYDMFLLCREIRDGGLIEFRVENFKGVTLTNELNPKTNFYLWSYREVGKMMKAVVDG